MDSCPDDMIVARFIDGAIPDKRLEQHLADCSTCRALVAVLAKGNVSSTASEPTLPPLLLAPGSQVGRYEVVECIGAGGMGVVYSARDPKLDRKIALKVVRSAEATAHARLLREGQAMARLSHPNVVTVHDVISQQGEVVVAMELVPGTTLSRWLQTGAHDWKAIVDVFVQACRGLAAAHAAGLVHRDFKPSNVFVRDDGRVQVGDFGLARKASDTPLPADGEESGLSDQVTRAGAVVGTPHYMAPEQKSGAADGRSDQYSLCVALREALQSLPESAPILEIRKIVARGSSEDPEQRYASLTELLGALEAVRSRERVSLVRRAVWASVAVLSLAVAIFMIARPRDASDEVKAPSSVAIVPFADHTGRPSLAYVGGGLARVLGTEMRTAGFTVIAHEELRAIDPADVVAWRQRARELDATFTVSGTLTGYGDEVAISIVLSRIDGTPIRVWTTRTPWTRVPSAVAAIAPSLITSASSGRLAAKATSPRELAIQRDLEHGKDAFRQLQLNDARRLLENVLRQEPDQSDALYYLGLTQWWQNEPRAVVDATYQRALKTTMPPDYVGALGAMVRMADDDYEAAIADLRALAERYPQSTQVRYALAEALYHGGRAAEGIVVYRLLVEEVPGWHLALGHALTFYSVHGDDEGFAWALARLPLLDPNAVRIWELRQRILRGELADAAATAKQLRTTTDTRDFDLDLAFLAIVLDDTAMLDKLATIQPARATLAIALLRGDRASARTNIDAELIPARDRKLRYNLVQLAPLVALSGDVDLVTRHLQALDTAIGSGRTSTNEQLARVFLLAALGRTRDIAATSSPALEVASVVKAFAANADGKPAVELWQRAFEQSSDGLFLVAGHYFLAGALAAAGDHQGVIETCKAVLGPRYVDLSVGPATPGCLTRTIAAYEALGDHANAGVARRRLATLRGRR